MSAATPEPMKFTPAFLEWKASESEAVETKSARVSEGAEEWELDRCPWWLDAQLRGDQVEVRPKYFGQFRGKVRIRATSGTRLSLRISSETGAPESAVREARRGALRRALWTQLAVGVLFC
jgi:hypothetical protein